MHLTKAWVAVNIASSLFSYRECSALNPEVSSKFFDDLNGAGSGLKWHRIQLLTSEFSVTWYCSVHSPGKAMCRDVTLQQLVGAGESLFKSLDKKRVLFIHIFLLRCITGEFNNKQDQKEVLRNSANYKCYLWSFTLGHVRLGC